jgi:NAD(P)-dependent dehydrogenase (short-subunit alcohol dehydrogenase family)
MSEQARQPPQEQPRQPGVEDRMTPRPASRRPSYKGADKLAGRVALITGGDSGIGRAVAVLFAREGADVTIAYLDEHEDAQETRALVEKEGRRAVTIAGDVSDQDHCQEVVERTVGEFGRLDVLVNNAAEQHEAESVEQITAGQLDQTFRTNVYHMFFMTRAALPHLRGRDGAAIVNTTSVTAYRGKPTLLDYSATKGAIVAFTRSLHQQVIGDGIRVNAVAPGPVWTPLIPASFSKEEVEQFGKNTPMGRPAQPEEIAPCYVFLASDDASYMAGQVLHPNGGQVINA